jgi:hypothetical protein
LTDSGVPRNFFGWGGGARFTPGFFSVGGRGSTNLVEDRGQR